MTPRRLTAEEIDRTTALADSLGAFTDDAGWVRLREPPPGFRWSGVGDWDWWPGCHWDPPECYAKLVYDGPPLAAA
jgi:hypothetical protein